MLQTFGTCTNCGEEVRAPNFQCPTGEQHIVEPKKYYMDDAPTDPGGREPGTFRPLGIPLRDSQTIICNLIPERKEMHGNDIHRIPGRNVTFKRGLYETADPEEQYYLDKRIGKGLCNRERWEQVYLTPEQRMQMDHMKLEADNKRLEQERNELLAQVQKKMQRVTA